MIRFLLGKEKPSKMHPVLNLWLRSSVVSFVQLVSRRHEFESHQSLNFFTLLVCNWLNCCSPARIISLLSFHFLVADKRAAPPSPSVRARGDHSRSQESCWISRGGL